MSTYYSRVKAYNIPFHTFEHIEIQKITIYRGNKFVYNLLPIFIKFQKMLKKRFLWFKNPKNLLQRELTGHLAYSQFPQFLQQ